MDQYSDNIFDTSRMAVRLTVEEGKATSWVTAQIDEETGQAVSFHIVMRGVFLLSDIYYFSAAKPCGPFDQEILR
jgi:hypothetical protein